MRIYLKNNPAKFHPDPIWNDEAFLKRSPHALTENKKKKNQMDGQRYDTSSWSNVFTD